MAEAKAEKKPTTYKVFLEDDNGNWGHVTDVEATNAKKALEAVTAAALNVTSETDASGSYMIVPRTNVTYLRPRLRVVKDYEVEEFNPDVSEPLAAVDESPSITGLAEQIAGTEPPTA